MEHIDDKMTRLEMYHRVINDIATALGYRMGDTFEPEALVKQVEQLVTYAELAKENSTAMAALAAVKAERDMVIAACRGTQMDTGGIRAVKELTNRTVKTESILAALRKPSDAVIEAAESCYRDEVVVGSLRRTIRAAVAAAEKEVGDDDMYGIGLDGCRCGKCASLGLEDVDLDSPVVVEKEVRDAKL